MPKASSPIARGLGKVFLAQLLSILASLLASVFQLLSAGEGLLILLLGLLSLALSVGAAAEEFLGLKLLSPLEEGFRTAYLLSVTSLAVVSLDLLASLFWPRLLSVSYDEAVYWVLNVAVCFFVIEAACKRLKEQNRPGEAALGRLALKAVFLGTLAQAGLTVAEIFLPDTPLEVPMNIVSGLNLCAACVYAVFLGKVRRGES